jgi:hypothetical protein
MESKTISREEFATAVAKELGDTIHKRKSRPAPPAGMKYKRDWYDKIPQNHLTADFFMQNIDAILDKTSQLNSLERAVILEICTRAVNKSKKSEKN